MTARPYVIDPMISAKEIAARVEQLARPLEIHYAGADKLVVVGLCVDPSSSSPIWCAS